MLLSLNWLKDFVDIPNNVPPEELGRRLTLYTVEVEKVERQSGKYEKVVAGKILEVKPHPNADRLRLALVDIGKEKLEIVCGAPNIEAGQFVPVALAGAVLPTGLVIKPTEIRGVKSNGMLCAEDELGLGLDHNGIMILGETPLIPLYKGDESLLAPLQKGGRGVKIGQSFAEYLKLNDVVFEVDNKSITHRADLWSIYGMARDISAFLNTKFKVYLPKKNILKAKRVKFRIKVKIEDFSLCSRYMAVGLENLKIASSPKWLQERLLACGMRPINNIVDATNYVMLELGQPLHAFDKNFIDHIVVRQARPGEVIQTLDGVKRKLEPDMLVIADKIKAVAIAGVMGGANSEINNKTDSIIIESANFNNDSVRKTAQKLGLRTEASMRFEKGLDPNLCELGIARAVELLLKICPGARVAGNLVDEKKFKLNQGPIELDLNWLNQFIGQKFEPKQVKQILEKLGFLVKTAGQSFKVTIPSWRAVHDISLKEDLAEEVARIYGYNNLKSELPKIDLTPPEVSEEKVLTRNIKNILSVGAGLTEVYNYSFLSAAQLKKINFSATVKLANPLSEDLAFLRPNLAIGMLENIKTNQASEDEIAIYEIGSIFLNKPGGIKKDDSNKEMLPFQEKRLTLALTGGGEAELFRKLKGVIEYLLKSLSLEATFEFAASEYNKFASAKILANGQDIGLVAELEKNIKQSFNIKKPTAIAEISLPALLNLVKNQPVRQFKEPPKHPSVVRDLAFVINEKILYNNIVKQIKNFSDLIAQVGLFDVYQGGKLGQGKKNLAFHIIYQADKTLTSEEVDEVQGKLVKHLEKEFEAKIRNF